MSESVLNHYICKIEGHGKLKLNYKEGKATLTINEGERLFERLVVGRNYLDAPFITARICGVCPTSHILSSIKAIEDAFNVRVTPNIAYLRKAMLCGQIIQSHALHLYFLAAPDYLDVVNAIELHEKQPHVFKNAISLKKVGDSLVEVIGGRAVHPTAPTVGGFLSVPKKDEIRTLIKTLEQVLPIAMETAELFSSFRYPSLVRKTEYLTTVKNGMIDYYEADHIISNKGLNTAIENYTYAFKENVRKGSPVKYGTRDGHGFMVGALSRISLINENLNPKAAYAYAKVWEHKFPTYNSFHNNVAQSIEIIHLIEEAIKQLTQVLDDKNEVFKVPYRVQAGQGFGVVEAPRGTLYHGVNIDESGVIKLYDIVTPTVQNLVNLEEDADALMKKHQKLDSDELYQEVEMLVRAYDPCITCAVH